MNAETGGGLDLARLREVAEAATPGPWETNHQPRHVYVEADDGTEVSGTYYAHSAGRDSASADAEHIATFDPPTVLALLDALADRDAALAGMRFRVEVACDGYANLTEDDIPSDVFTEDDYIAGAADASTAIRAALHPAPREAP